MIKFKFTFLLAFACLVISTLSAQESYKPRIFGLVKALYEVDTYDGRMAFSVRNSRIGIRGNMNPYWGYLMQMQLNSRGTLEILDVCVSYRRNDFEFSIGQQQYQFGTELNRGTSKSYFADHSFIGRFITTYYDRASDGPELHHIGSRDIGVMVQHHSNESLPVYALLGVFKGGGIRIHEWSHSVSVTGKVGIGPQLLNGLCGGINGYYGHTPYGDRMVMYGANLNYIRGNWIIEGEYASRLLGKGTGDDTSDMVAVNVVRTCPLNRKIGPLKFIAPMVRWDYGRDVPFENTAAELERFSGNRITAGITLGMGEKLFQKELRINYEHYLINGKPSDYGNNPLLHNKVVLELFMTF